MPGVTAVLALSNSSVVGACSSNCSASALPGGVVCSVSVMVGYHIGLTYSLAACCDTLVTSTTYLQAIFREGVAARLVMPLRFAAAQRFLAAMDRRFRASLDSFRD